MKKEMFDKIVEEQFGICKNILIDRANSYSAEEDRLANFKRGAKYRNTTPEDFGWGLVTKQLVALEMYIEKLRDNEERPDMKLVTEWVTDIMNYCMLIKALMLERISN